eukprot:jgi/Botrbrau1/21584/Bobra.0898s0002.1
MQFCGRCQGLSISVSGDQTSKNVWTELAPCLNWIVFFQHAHKATRIAQGFSPVIQRLRRLEAPQFNTSNQLILITVHI